MADAVPYQLIQTAYEQMTLDPYTSGAVKFVIVVDADTLLSSIENHCRTGRRSRILRLADSRNSVVFAEDHVYGETYRGLEKFASSRGVALDQLRACFEEDYLPQIRWVRTDGYGIDDSRVALVTDQTDVPTAELASLIAPCLVLSEDRSLRRPGFAPEQWRVAASHGTEIVAGAGMQEVGTMMIGLPPVAVVGGGIKLGEKVGIPWWGTLIVLAVVAGLVLRSPERRKVIAEKAWPVLDGFMHAMEQAYEQERIATSQLKELLCPAAAPPTPKQQVATIMARKREPLLAKEIQELIEVYFKEEIPTIAEVRDILRDGSEFFQPERYRWQLGREAGPWRG